MVLDMLEIVCPICSRLVPEEHQEKHHLIPKCKKGKETIIICSDCAKYVHQVFTISELKNNLNTIELIINNSKMLTWIKWIKNKNKFGFIMARKKKK